MLVINSTRPRSEETQQLRGELAAKYDIPVMTLSAANMSEDDVTGVLREVLYEFPVHEVNVNLPSWVMVLGENHWLRSAYENSVRDTVKISAVCGMWTVWSNSLLNMTSSTAQASAA